MNISSLYTKDVSKQFFKFCLIGLESTILTYLIFIILFYYLSINYLIASAIGFIAGVFLGFIFNKRYTFESNKKSSVTLPQYFLIYLISLGFDLLALSFLVESAEIHPLISKVLILPIIVLINFFGAKIFVFKNKKW